MSATPAKPRSRKRVLAEAAAIPEVSHEGQSSEMTAAPIAAAPVPVSREDASSETTVEPPLPFYAGHPDEGAAEAATFDAFTSELAAVSHKGQSSKTKAPRLSRKSDPVETKPVAQRSSASAKPTKVSRKVDAVETKASVVQPVAPGPAGKLYGYARVSTTDQDLSIQEMALRIAGCEVIRAEKVTGTTTAGRVELATLLDFLRPGDTLVVTRVDRLARSIGDLQDIVRQLRAKGVTLRATEQPIDTGTAAGKAFLDMLGVFAEFETNLRRERQLEGIAKAKAEGVYKGRPATIEAEQVRTLHAQGIGPTAIASQLKIGRASVYRLLAEPKPKA